MLATDRERLVEEWVEDEYYAGHFYSYQPCQLHGTYSNSHGEPITCQVALHVTEAIPDIAGVNYRLSNFYYSILEFALSWNPLQLMAMDDFVVS